MLRVIFVVLMMFWLFLGGSVAYSADKFNPVLFGSAFIPWLCVAILGWVNFSDKPAP